MLRKFVLFLMVLSLAFGPALSLGTKALAGEPVNGEPDHNSVHDYNINWVIQTGAAEITVEVQANYCLGCNPNPANEPGCSAFTHGYPPPYYPYYYWNNSCYNSNGRYCAVRLKDSSGNIIATEKMVLNPANWPLGTIVKKQIIFTGLPLMAGDLVTVEADLFCNWCGHYYPMPKTIQVTGTNSTITYVGDTSSLVGATANVKAKIEDASTGTPLPGRNITFTLDSLPPVTAVSDSSGIASATIMIPTSMEAGTYNLNVRFAGDAAYFPASQDVPFQVIVNRPPTAEPSGPYSASEGSPVSFNGSLSNDPDGDPLTYVWDFGDGVTASEPSPSHIYADNGAYTVTLTVTDPDGLSDTKTTTAIISNEAPKVDAGPDVTIFSGQTLNLSAGFIDPGAEDMPWNYTVDWGDMTFLDGSTDIQGPGTVAKSHDYFTPGTYSVTITVTDKDGGVGSDVLTVTVKPLPVMIDIKPCSDPNSIALWNKGNVPVGVFSGDYQGITFDATTIERSSLVFAGASDLGIGTLPKDLDADGDMDMVFHFKTQELNLNTASTMATLTGKTTTGIYFEGTDSVRILPAR